LAAGGPAAAQDTAPAPAAPPAAAPATPAPGGPQKTPAKSSAQIDAGEPRADTSAGSPAAAPATPAPGGPQKSPAKASAQTDAGEPRADTSPGSPAAATPRTDTPPGPPGAATPRTTVAARPPRTAPRAPGAADRLELGTATVTGEREQPKVMYIVPWKKSDIGDLSGKPMNSLLDEALAPVDRDEFRREVTYYNAVTTDAPQNGAAATPAQGEK
jgi:hypothetical protein